MRSRNLTIVVFLATVLALLALDGAVSSAHRVPGHRGRTALRHAVERSTLVPGSVTRGRFHLRHPVVSTKGPWAKATIDPEKKFDTAEAVFKRRHGHWRLRALGTSGVGCSHPRVPRVVRRDLRIHC